MSKVVYSDSYGGFALPDQVTRELEKRKGFRPNSIGFLGGVFGPDLRLHGEIPRHDPDLVEIVETCKASGVFVGGLEIVDIGDATRYWVEECDGLELVHYDDEPVDWVYIEPKPGNEKHGVR